MRSGGLGLRAKFSALMIGMVIVIVLGVAVPLIAILMIPRERRQLAEGLRDRANILLESVASRAAAAVRTGASGYFAVTSFPSEVSSMGKEAQYMTISGPGDPTRDGAPPREDPLDRDYLWATNDPNVPPVGTEIARRRVNDPLLDREKVAAIAASVNADAAQALRDLPATGLSRDQEANAERLLREVAGDPRHSGSIPAFDPERLADTYLFYRPLVARDEAGHFFSGMVRLGISTEMIDGELRAVRDRLLWVSLVIALAAIGAGIIGAIVLANIAIRPIRKLAAGVQAIREAEDRTKLREIPVGPRDELGQLTERVNEMTRGLVTAAIAEKDMVVGRAIQKQFMPLEAVAGGDKGSTGGILDPQIDLYAYYEGSSAVSGDFFDFQKLDDQYYALIKGDVSGHGAPAAFIMVEVATLFLRWCREWRERLGSKAYLENAQERERIRKELQQLDDLAYMINDMIEERGFPGFFAAFMACLYDTKSGEVIACNAGDNILYWYDAQAGRMAQQEVKPGNPAAGRIPSDMIRAGSGFASVRHRLNRGDILVLFTDGFDEANRHARNADGTVVKRKVASQEGPREPNPTATEKEEEVREDLGVARILDVFSTCLARGTYRLNREHPAGSEELVFDFSSCTGTVKEAVLALVSVERVFRLYRDPGTGPRDRIQIERKIDEFLARHFKQYQEYLGERLEGTADAAAVTVTSIKEDPQDDDLTVVLMRRP